MVEVDRSRAPYLDLKPPMEILDLSHKVITLITSSFSCYVCAIPSPISAMCSFDQARSIILQRNNDFVSYDNLRNNVGLNY